MTCWTCRKQVIVPSREVPNDGAPYPQSHTVEVACHGCRAVYQITTVRMGQLVVPEPPTESDEAKDRRKGWE